METTNEIEDALPSAESSGGVDRDQARKLLLPIVKAALRNAMEKKMGAAKEEDAPGPLMESQRAAMPEPGQLQKVPRSIEKAPPIGPMVFDVKRDGAGLIRQIVLRE